MIYLVRHGLDDENYIGGWSDVELISEGVKQIENSREFIIKYLKLKRIITSDIKRATSTAKIINEKLGLILEIDNNLRELDKGDYTGVKKDTLTNEEKEFIKNITIYDKYPNGESMKDFYERIVKIIPSLANYEDSLVVTHRGVINMIYYYLNNIDVDMNKERFNVTHGSVHELDLNNKKIRRIY